MKKLLTLILSCALAIAAAGQGTAIRSDDGRGTNTTFYEGITFNPSSLSPANTGITNVGPMVIWLGSGILGTQLNIVGTNQTAILTYVGDTFSINSDILILNGASAVRVPVTNAFLGVDSNGKIGSQFNGQSLSNIYESNISVLTNTWGNATVNFSLGTQLRTNLAGNLTLTGCSSMNASNVNWQEIFMDANGATRTLVVPGDWVVAGFFTNATTAAITNGTFAKLRVQAWSGINTNASLEIYQ
jgi:hypothetical protein